MGVEEHSVVEHGLQNVRLALFKHACDRFLANTLELEAKFNSGRLKVCLIFFLPVSRHHPVVQVTEN